LLARDKRRPRHAAERQCMELAVGVEAVHAYLSGVDTPLQQWQVRDAGERGFGLVCNRASQFDLQVGALLGAVSGAQPEQAGMRLLVVRWVRAERNAGISMGVECLEGSPEAVRIGGSGASSSDAGGLLLSNQDGEDAMARLVTPPQLYTDTGGLLVYLSGHELPVRCGDVVEQTPGFDCFEFMLEAGDGE